MELVLPMYNVHPYFSLKNLGKNCTLYTAKYGTSVHEKVLVSQDLEKVVLQFSVYFVP